MILIHPQTLSCRAILFFAFEHLILNRNTQYHSLTYFCHFNHLSYVSDKWLFFIFFHSISSSFFLLKSGRIPKGEKIIPVLNLILLKNAFHSDFKACKQLIKLQECLRMLFRSLQPFFLVKPYQETLVHFWKWFLIWHNHFTKVF